MLKHVGTLFLLLTGLVFGHVGIARAATPAEPVQQSVTPGINVSPAVQDKVLGPQDKSANFEVRLTNLTNKPITFSISSVDFTTLNQTGGLSFLGSDSQAVTNGHGLSNVLELDSRLVTVPAGETKLIKATVNNVSRLAPGGHYAAILSRALPDDTDSGNQVAINQVVSSLVFLETAGKGTKTLEFLPFKFPKVQFTLPRSLNLAFKATGNTQSVPRGLATINRGDTQLMNGIINENSSILLPDSTRLLPTTLKGDNNPLLPGMYELDVQYRYEGGVGVSSKQISFLYINIPATLAFIAGLLVILIAAWRGRRKLWSAIKRSQPAATKPERVIVVHNRSKSDTKVDVKTSKH